MIDNKNNKQNYDTSGLLDIVNAMIVSLDSDGNITLLNKKSEEVIGRSKKELLGKNWFDVCLPDRIKDEVRGVFKKIIEGKGDSVEHYENPIINKKGKERVIEWFNTELKNEKGDIVGLLTSGIDITEKVEAENALIKSEKRFKMIFNNSPEIIIFFDPQGNIKEINDNVRNFLGYDKSFFLNKNLFKLPVITENTKKIVFDNFSKRIRGEKVLPYDVGIIARDGSIRIGHIVGSQVKNNEGNILGELIMISDITEQKKTEEMYRLVTENTSDLIAIAAFSEAPKYLYVNPSYEKILGYTPEELLGENILKNISPENLGKIAVVLNKYLKGKDVFTTEILEFKFKHKSGKFINLESVVNLVGDKLVIISRDITERKRSEEELKKKLEELERFNRATVGRELKMVELKNDNERLREEIKKLKKK